MRIKTQRSLFPALLLALTLALLAAPARAATLYGGGSGTKDDPFLIATKEHLEALRGAVNAGTSYAGRYFKLTQDIDLEETRWTTCIGEDLGTPFEGNFDGGGHAITGLKVNVINDNDIYAGLFGWVDGGTISRLAVSGDVAATCTITGNYNVYAGGIVGRLERGMIPGTIEGCSFTGTVMGTSSNIVCAGGIVGRVAISTVTGCAVYGVSITANGYDSRAGGIAGEMNATSTTSAQMTSCVAEATVTAQGTYPFAGGVIGSVSLAVTSGNTYHGNAAHGIGHDFQLAPQGPSNDGAAKATGPSIVTVALPGGTAGTWLSWGPFRAAPTGGVFAWSAKGLPKGLELDKKSGVLSGIPEKEGTYDIEVTVESGGQTATRTYAVVIGESQSGRFAVKDDLPNAFVRQSYRHELSTAGGKAASWRIEDGALPKGMKFNEARGRISGTPRKAGDYAFVVTAEKTDGTTASRRLTLKVLEGGAPGATLKAVGVATVDGMAEVPLSGTATFELGEWFGEDGKPVEPASLTVIVDGEAQTVSVTNGRFTLPATEDAEYELWVEATLPDGTTLKSETLYVVAGRGTLSAPGLTASPTSARADEIVTFDLGEWINRREIVTPESVRWILNGVDVTELVIDGVLTVEAVAGEDGTMVLIVTATLPNGLTGTATATVTISAGPAPGPGPGPDEGSSSSGGCGNVGFGALAMIACASLILRRRS